MRNFTTCFKIFQAAYHLWNVRRTLTNKISKWKILSLVRLVVKISAVRGRKFHIIARYFTRVVLGTVSTATQQRHRHCYGLKFTLYAHRLVIQESEVEIRSTFSGSGQNYIVNLFSDLNRTECSMRMKLFSKLFCKFDKLLFFSFSDESIVWISCSYCDLESIHGIQQYYNVASACSSRLAHIRSFVHCWC